MARPRAGRGYPDPSAPRPKPDAVTRTQAPPSASLYCRPLAEPSHALRAVDGGPNAGRVWPAGANRRTVA
jgi:hypothetical protein